MQVKQSLSHLIEAKDQMVATTWSMNLYQRAHLSAVLVTPCLAAFCLDWELNQKVNSAGVIDNLFTVVYTSLAVEKLGDDQDHNK